MNIASRISISLLVTLMALCVGSTAAAAGRGGGRVHHPDHDRRGSGHRPEVSHPELRPGEELNRGPIAHPGRRGCRRGVRLARGRHCDYYYDDNEDARAAVPAAYAPAPASSPGAAKIAPSPESSDVTESYTPNLDEQLREKLISARKNWLEKQSQLDAASAARAKAEYSASQTGSSVAPTILARQQQAKEEAAAAHAALGPLVQQARDAGIAPEVLDLYERATTPD